MVSQALFENYFKASLAFATNSPKALSSEIAISESIYGLRRYQLFQTIH